MNFKTIKDILDLREKFETKRVLKMLNEASRNLGELKGISKTIPNEEVLSNFLPIQEAVASSRIENIITTVEEVYKSNVDNGKISLPTKEVQNYAQALKQGFKQVKERKLLTNNMIINIQGILKQDNNASFRKQKVDLKSNRGEIIYTPPQKADEVQFLMADLEKFINDGSLSDLDPLIKMAIIHHQFETIHPFLDGNGRTGRIINILYLCLKELLDLSILYLSRYIVEQKETYYDLLQIVREKANGEVWEDWIIFILKGVGICSIETNFLINQIVDLMRNYKSKIRVKYPNIYSQDLINALFKYPYTHKRSSEISKRLAPLTKQARHE